MEKEHQPDSMATITMKPEYPPSEVYSASEPPPAYRHGTSSSVQIARIIALTVVASSLILGSFILASSWVSARASCHQLEQLDAMLDKELALEGRAYGNDALVADEPLPVSNAHALHAAPPQPTLQAPDAPRPASGRPAEDAFSHAESKIDENKLQKLGESGKKDGSSDNEDSSESDSSAEDDDDLEALRPVLKLPVQFDLDELAGAFLANSQKGRMNCVVERRNEEPMERRFPFNILGAFAPQRPAQGERIAIICHGGDEPRPMVPEPASQVFAFPLSGPVRLPMRPQPEPSRDVPVERVLSFAPLAQRRPAPFPMPMPWDSSSEDLMVEPREMRIHVQRVIAIPAPHALPAQEHPGPFAPPPPPPQEMHDHTEQQDVMHQFVPQPAPTQDMDQPEEHKMASMPMSLPWGLTPEDIQVIQRSAEDAAAAQRHADQQQQVDNDMQEVKTIVNTLAAAAAEAEAEAAAAEEQRRAQLPPAPDAPRAPRTLLLPQDAPADERPHFVQPRSVRSVDSLLHREKRVKRCACDCA